MRARLSTVAGPIEIGEKGITGGSGKRCQVQLEGPARIFGIHVIDDEYCLECLSDATDVFINARPVKRAVLRIGDRIEIGGVIFYFEDEEDDPLAMLGEDLDALYEDRAEEGIMAATAAIADFVKRRGLTRLRKKLESGENLGRLQEASRALSMELDPKKLLACIMDESVAFAKAERGFLLLDDEKGGFTVSVARNFDKESVPRPLIKVSRSVADEVRKTGKPVVSTNAQEDERFEGHMSIAALRLRSIACVPLRARGSTLGSLYLDNRFEKGAFTEEDLPLLQAFGDHAAIALENARLMSEAIQDKKDLEKANVRVGELNKILSERVARQEVELTEVRQILRERQPEYELKYAYDNIIGRSPRMREVLTLLDRVTDGKFPILIQGESGTGKELVARAVHFNGPRRRGPFVSENCAAIPDTLLESELFGYVAGAFTGADGNKKGLLELASDGTLFLDEIADMSMEMQKKLLRVLEQGEVRPVGGKRTIPVDVRTISASNRSLRDLAERKEFRDDLLYRLNVVTVELPPLRDRVEDIPALVDHFLSQVASQMKEQRKEIDDEALAVLMAHEWPGNIRELRNEIQRACALSDRIILPETLSGTVQNASSPLIIPGRHDDRGLKEITQEAVGRLERRIIQESLDSSGWRKSETARKLKISRPTLDHKISRYDLMKPDS
jgi:transcriptional regulator with GAF, ATPase, and Fis domain